MKCLILSLDFNLKKINLIEFKKKLKRREIMINTRINGTLGRRCRARHTDSQRIVISCAFVQQGETGRVLATVRRRLRRAPRAVAQLRRPLLERRRRQHRSQLFVQPPRPYRRRRPQRRWAGYYPRAEP